MIPAPFVLSLLLTAFHAPAGGPVREQPPRGARAEKHSNGSRPSRHAGALFAATTRERA
jgi:hypothetical protein